MTIMLVVMSQHKNRSGWLLRLHILLEAVTILMLHQEMLDTKTSVILGNATGEEVQGSHPEGTEDGGGQEVGPVTAIEKEIDGIDLIGIVVLIEIVNGIVDVIETEIEKDPIETEKVIETEIEKDPIETGKVIETKTETETGKETEKENGQRVDHLEEIVDRPAVVTVINTKRVSEKGGKGVRIKKEISRKRSKMNQKITLNELYYFTLLCVLQISEKSKLIAIVLN